MGSTNLQKIYDRFQAGDFDSVLEEHRTLDQLWILKESFGKVAWQELEKAPIETDDQNYDEEMHNSHAKICMNMIDQKIDQLTTDQMASKFFGIFIYGLKCVKQRPFSFILPGLLSYLFIAQALSIFTPRTIDISTRTMVGNEEEGCNLYSHGYLKSTWLSWINPNEYKYYLKEEQPIKSYDECNAGHKIDLIKDVLPL